MDYLQMSSGSLSKDSLLWWLLEQSGYEDCFQIRDHLPDVAELTLRWMGMLTVTSLSKYMWTRHMHYIIISLLYEHLSNRG